MKKNENAFTGLEAAIVLIAFVVVAAVFSYVMLGAGFFTAQKAQDVVHSGIGQAASSIEVVGDVYGEASEDNADNLTHVRFRVQLTSGMSNMNLGHMRVTYADSGAIQQLSFNNTHSYGNPGDPHIGGEPNRTQWRIMEVYNREGYILNNNTVIRPGEQFLLQLGVPESATPNTRFTISMQPEMGALTTIVRSVPASIYKGNVLR
ncbi:archaellin/type IV pilin N-terminal domain-containing protein [Methanocalculus chunghsingensis]|nr:archaellin/type IV pilin N-terminal domain-containing protein [Methanocalculus chunghsingensis]